MKITKYLLRTSMVFAFLATSGHTADETTVGKYTFKGDTVVFKNPCYRMLPSVEEKMGFQTVDTVEITNGSSLNFAAKGVIGDVVRVAETLNDVPNPFGLSHSGFVVNLDPRVIYTKVVDIMPGGKSHSSRSLSERAGKAILRELEDSHRESISATTFPEVRASFAIESWGSVGELLHGITPHVRIRGLESCITEYDGNMFVRPLNENVPSNLTLDFMTEYVGRPYESFSTFRELLKSVTSCTEEERVENVFCSELVSLFYKRAGIFDKGILSNNVIPEMLGSGAGERDLLRGKALDDIPLKLSFSLYNRSEADEYYTCGTSLIKKLCECLHARLLGKK